MTVPAQQLQPLAPLSDQPEADRRVSVHRVSGRELALACAGAWAADGEPVVASITPSAAPCARTTSSPTAPNAVPPPAPPSLSPPEQSHAKARNPPMSNATIR